MCGIAGYAGWNRPPEVQEADLTAMCGVITHRGPDDEGHFVAPGVALGMRRLSIIDVACGHQPIANEDGRIQVVFNGEIYNHRALQPALERAGHRFRTHSDTETLVHLYEEYGDEMVHHLRGMFAFAIWDAARGRLFAARDRLGIKPLHCWIAEDGVAFASEARSLRAFPPFTARIDPAAVADYLAFGYVPESRSLYQGVTKVPPGHRLSWTREAGARIERYWSPVRAEVAVDEQEAVEEIRRLLADAVECHLESEVPLGAFLSGGVDSSAVVAQMTRLVSEPVRTFAIGFDEGAFNEAPHAAEVARALGTRHTELTARPDVDALLERVVLGFDEPFADSSALPTFLVSELARQQVTVALSGDGGDELFGGYTRYATVLGRGELPPLARAGLGLAVRGLPHGMRGRGRLVDMAQERAGRYGALVAQPLLLHEGGVARPDLAGGRRTLTHLFRPLFESAAARDFATQLMLVDVQSYLPGDILTKVDRMSMAVSLEARVPLLDHLFVEFALSLPSRLKLRDGTGKWVFRQAITGLVPDAVLHRPKQGFSMPLGLWLRRELRHRVDAMLRPDSPIYAYVDLAATRRLAHEHVSGRRNKISILWRLIVLDLWLRAYAR